MIKIEELFDSDENSEDKKTAPENTQENTNTKNPTKQRLQSLKDMLDSDPVKINTDNMLLHPDIMPQSQNIKLVDYVDEKTKHRQYAERIVTNIVKNYIKSPKLLASPRLIDLVDQQVTKYARLLLLVDIAERNLITLQEALDGGDMSTEVFETNMRAQTSLSTHETNCEKHISMCEKYWAAYSDQYGMENEETKIVQETEVKTDEKNRMILNATDIIERIRMTNQPEQIIQQETESDKKKSKKKKES